MLRSDRSHAFQFTNWQPKSRILSSKTSSRAKRKLSQARCETGKGQRTSNSEPGQIGGIALRHQAFVDIDERHSRTRRGPGRLTGRGATRSHDASTSAGVIPIIDDCHFLISICESLRRATSPEVPVFGCAMSEPLSCLQSRLSSSRAIRSKSERARRCYDSILSPMTTPCSRSVFVPAQCTDVMPFRSCAEESALCAGSGRNANLTDEVEVKALSGLLQMKWSLGTLLLTLLTSASFAYPQPVRWQTYSIAETGTSVDIPTSIFTEKAEGLGGYGERLRTADGRAELTVAAGLNSDNDTPARFLAKRNPPAHIQYKRVTSRFFAVSGYKRDKVYYSRCNFSHGVVSCVTMHYPAREERDWDDVVTRISLSLSGK